MKPALNLEESKFRKSKTSLGPTATRVNDGDVVLSALALEGADIWSDPDMRRGFFVSDRLAQALRRDGFFDWFNFKTCEIRA